jgi:ABC-type lipoprotein export system ATPase subunit
MLKAGDQPVLEARGVARTFRIGREDVHVLRGVDLAVRRGEWVAVLGRSGSGKSTLLHLLGGLDRPDGGEVWFEGQAVHRMRRSAVDRYRASRVGFVFQSYHLLPELTAMDNVLIAAMVLHGPVGWLGARSAAKVRAGELLERVGLGGRLRSRPGKLSGGERQRVAIARALMNEPAVLLADEPTGNLDAATGRSIMQLLQQLHAAGQAIVMVTHDDAVAAAADRRVRLTAGLLETQ